MIKAALAKPITVLVALAGIVLFAVLALLSIPVDIFPRLNLPTIYIAQPYGGMTPAQMEGFIATRYQNQLLYVSGIKNVEVKNIQGLCLVKCSFYEDVNMAQVSGEVANQVSRVMNYLPPGTVPPTVVRFDASSLPVGQLVFSSRRASLGEMQDLASTRIRPLFSQIPGASAPPPFGGNERTVVVKVNPERMRSYELTPDEIVQAVVKNNQISPAGSVQMGDYTVMTPSNTVLDKVGEFMNIPLRKGVGPTVFLRDVATVEDATDITVGYALVNGKRSVYIPVTKSADASTMSVVNALKAKLPEMKALLPDDVQLSYEFDQSVYVTQAVHSLALEGGLGAILTGLMVLLFLGDWRSSLIVILTIPVSIMSAILLLNLTGQTINIMTLSGLALAIGILVDQATVVIENIHQHLEMGKPKARAILDACQEMSFPLLLITLCILAVFAPAFLMNGVPRGMFLPLSLSVGFSIIASYILSQTFVPVVANWWLKNHEHAHPHDLSILPDLENQPEARQEHYEEKHPEKVTGFERFKLGYLRLLDKMMGRRTVVIGVYALVCALLIGIGFTQIGQDMMPRQNHAHQFQVRIVGPQGLRIERTEALTKRVIKQISDIVGPQNIAISSAFVGMTPSSYGTSALYVFNAGPHEAVLQVNLSEDYKVESLDALKEQVRQRIRQKMPNVRLSFEPIDLTDKIMSQGAQTPIEILVGGKDLIEGQHYANRLLTRLREIPYLRDLRINQPLSYPTVSVKVDRERAAQLGLSTDEISKSLVAATSSSRFTAKNLWLDQSKGFAYQVQIQLEQDQMKSVADIQAIPLVKGQLRPTLGDVATITPTTIPGQYDRIGPRRIITVSANINNRDLGTATRDVQAAITAAGDPPKGSVVELRGLAQLLQETLSSLQFGLGLAIVVIFLLLAANYQSFKVASVVLVSIPAVLAGALTLLLVTGQTLNLQSYMGIIMSVGVSVANALLLVTNAESLRLRYRDARAAARVAGAARLRPILMTALAMIAGMIPMASGLGESGEQTAPLGRAVIGGLLFSTVAALLILPVVFAAVQRKTTFDSPSLDPDDPTSTVYDGIPVAATESHQTSLTY
ncbi:MULTISPECIES: efflux RND transporter permease subunit [unclassified Spirosoma]|uniref:efflux RND transporter permease subunit n=1 Tax=unclassified Spirosoma TaxID=2621999 RepID=UPI0009692A9E|nr:MULTISPECIES: efflux RND transporter permease subunit [unclassified Spirosoma]MBN8823186.1 efflux RND transporter permease subunit [Spirosoma sp.]OJW72663.1 MAG: acriflavin resistance protein [Spirosoma sp. 48-14]